MTGQGPARTSGGKWDPTSPNLAFLAGTVSDHRASGNDTILVAINEINTPDDMYMLDRWCDSRRVLLDSGVFALAAAYARAHSCTIGQAFAAAPEEMEGWPELYDKWCRIATRYADRLWGVIELDQGGADAATRTRTKVAADTGLTPMPVYHPFSDGWDYFDTLAAGHDRICVGGLAGRIPAPTRMRLCWTVADRARAYPHLWTHLLGVTPTPMLLSLGLRGSTDSSAWLAPIRWATSWQSSSMLVRTGRMPRTMIYDFDAPSSPLVGRPKAHEVCSASAAFQQATVAAVRDDTHPPLELP